MGLNLTGNRRMSLKGFALGWDDCYLIIKVISRPEAQELNDRVDALQGTRDEKALDALLRDFLVEHIVSGMIINTLDDGTQEPHELSKDEVPQLLDFLNFSWQIEAVSIASGADRLKVRSN